MRGLRRKLGLCTYFRCAPAMATHLVYFARPCGCWHITVNQDAPMCELHMNMFRHPSHKVEPTKCKICGQTNRVYVLRVEKMG